MTDYRTASEMECMEFIASVRGHTQYATFIPIDTADIPLPPGWSWDSVEFSFPERTIVACALKMPGNGTSAHAPTERLARWRCAALAWERYVSETKEPARE